MKLAIWFLLSAAVVALGILLWRLAEHFPLIALGGVALMAVAAAALRWGRAE